MLSLVSLNKQTSEMKYLKNDGGRKKAFPNSKAKIGDCVIRAIAIATGEPYQQVWNDMFQTAKETGYFPNDDEVCHAYLKKRGWQRVKASELKKGVVRLNSKFIPKNKTIICHIRRHWVCVNHEVVNDIWDCRLNSHDQSARVFSYWFKPKAKLGLDYHGCFEKQEAAWMIPKE